MTWGSRHGCLGYGSGTQVIHVIVDLDVAMGNESFTSCYHDAMMHALHFMLFFIKYPHAYKSHALGHCLRENRMCKTPIGYCLV